MEVWKSQSFQGCPHPCPWQPTPLLRGLGGTRGLQMSQAMDTLLLKCPATAHLGHLAPPSSWAPPAPHPPPRQSPHMRPPRQARREEESLGREDSTGQGGERRLEQVNLPQLHVQTLGAGLDQRNPPPEAGAGGSVPRPRPLWPLPGAPAPSFPLAVPDPPRHTDPSGHFHSVLAVPHLGHPELHRYLVSLHTLETALVLHYGALGSSLVA